MVSAKLTSSCPGCRAVSAVAAGVLGLTGLGVALALIDPPLAGHTRPHPVLPGSLGDALSIAEQNARVLATPFLLGWLGFARAPLGRRIGDAALLVLTAASTVTVGVELGRWRERLLPYIPQLPIEWAALTISLSAWLLIRSRGTRRSQLAALAVLTVVLLIAAAGIETWCTPHRHIRPQASPAEVDTIREPTSVVGDGGCPRRGLCAAAGQIASRSPAPFPSPRSVPLGLPGGADRAHVNHRPPPGGIT